MFDVVFRVTPDPIRALASVRSQDTTTLHPTAASLSIHKSTLPPPEVLAIMNNTQFVILIRVPFARGDFVDPSQVSSDEIVIAWDDVNMLRRIGTLGRTARYGR